MNPLRALLCAFWRILGALVLGALVALAIPAVAQAESPERYSADIIKAVFLYRFTGFIEWPPAAPAGDFSIAVLGDDGVADALAHLLAGRSIKGRPASVHKAKRPEDLGNAQIVYVGPDRAGDLAAVAAVADHRPMLIVSSDERGLAHGSAVNFILVDQHVRFEVSLAAANRAGLQISSDLLSVATRVLGGGATSIGQPGGIRVAGVPGGGGRAAPGGARELGEPCQCG
jgi:hypothetical protein